jgi:hypothetical protein
LDVELDVLFIDGRLVVGHDEESFGKYLKTNSNALGEQNLGLLIDACVEKRREFILTSNSLMMIKKLSMSL